MVLLFEKGSGTGQGVPVILFGHFYRLLWESFSIKNGLNFPNFMYFSTYYPNFYDIFSQYERKGSFPK